MLSVRLVAASKSLQRQRYLPLSLLSDLSNNHSCYLRSSSGLAASSLLRNIEKEKLEIRRTIAWGLRINKWVLHSSRFDIDFKSSPFMKALNSRLHRKVSFGFSACEAHPSPPILQVDDFSTESTLSVVPGRRSNRFSDVLSLEEPYGVPYVFSRKREGARLRFVQSLFMEQSKRLRGFYTLQQATVSDQYNCRWDVSRHQQLAYFSTEPLWKTNEDEMKTQKDVDALKPPILINRSGQRRRICPFLVVNLARRPYRHLPPHHRLKPTLYRT